MNRRSFWIVALGLMLGLPSFTFAQNRGGGGFDPSQFKERRMNDLKDQLGATAEEWTVIQPKLDKVLTEQFTQMASRFGGMRGGGGRTRGGDNNGGNNNAADRSSRPRPGADTPIGKASAELRDAVDKKDTPQEEIATKLKALRDAKAKAKADLEAAQKDLQSVLTPRQEAVLVSNSVLE